MKRYAVYNNGDPVASMGVPEGRADVFDTVEQAKEFAKQWLGEWSDSLPDDVVVGRKYHYNRYGDTVEIREEEMNISDKVKTACDLIRKYYGKGYTLCTFPDEEEGGFGVFGGTLNSADRMTVFVRDSTFEGAVDKLILELSNPKYSVTDGFYWAKINKNDDWTVVQITWRTGGASVYSINGIGEGTLDNLYEVGPRVEPPARD